VATQGLYRKIANVRLLSRALVIILLISACSILSISPALAGDFYATVLTDDEMNAIEARGFYFRMDMSIEALTDTNTPPQVVVNTGTPITSPTGNSTSSISGPSSSITLAGNAQSNISSLVNIVGAASVINVGVNVVTINNSSNTPIYTTNINTGSQGTNFTVNVPILP
jgi:hypothetical protein